jgi:nucleotide-binding universal stress UspA family protein
MRRILVAVDMSGSAHAVVEQAVALARPTGARLRLFYVIPDLGSPPPSRDEAAGSHELHVKAWTLAAEETLRDLEESIPESLRDGVDVEVGRPAERVCDAARAYGADLVVIGAHRYGPLERALGTTAARIVDRMDRPLVVVRPLAVETRASGRAPPRGAK